MFVYLTYPMRMPKLIMLSVR